MSNASAQPGFRRTLRFSPWMLLPLVAALLVLWASVRSRAPAPIGQNHPAAGARLADLRLTTLDEQAAELGVETVAGHVVLLNFWGTWCGPCAIEFPGMVELEHRYGDLEDFMFLSVSCPLQPADDLRTLEAQTRQFMRRYGADFAVYADPRGTTRRAVQQAVGGRSFAMPTTVVLDANLVIRGVWVGYRPGDERNMEALLQGLL